MSIMDCRSSGEEAIRARSSAYIHTQKMLPTLTPSPDCSSSTREVINEQAIKQGRENSSLFYPLFDVEGVRLLAIPWHCASSGLIPLLQDPPGVALDTIGI